MTGSERIPADAGVQKKGGNTRRMLSSLWGAEVFLCPETGTDKWKGREQIVGMKERIQEIRENGFGRENVPAMMAAVVVISVPLIILFLIFRKKIMAGVSRGGTKG